jgi:hypothetical protein
MKFPGFTAEASLGRTRLAYHASASRASDDRLAYPAQSLLTNRNYLSPISMRWPIMEPNCVRICLRGHCRWICF